MLKWINQNWGDGNGGPYLALSPGTFEVNASGAVPQAATARLTGETFNGTAGAALPGVSFTGLPAGLTGIATKTSDTTVTISFTGAATGLEPGQIASVGVIFGNAAFTGGSAAAVAGSSKVLTLKKAQPSHDPYEAAAMPFVLSDLGSHAVDQTVLQIREKGGYVFAVGQIMLTVIDYNDPENPRRVYQRAYTGDLAGNTLNAPDCLIDGSILYVASRRSGAYGTETTEGTLLYSVITAFDIANPAEPVVLQDLKLNWDAVNGGPLITSITLLEQGGSKYIVGAGNSYPGCGTIVIDVSNPAAMAVTSFVKNTDVTPANQGHGVCAISGTTAVLGNYNSAAFLRAIDLSAPSAPVFGASIARTTFPSSNAWRVKAIGGGIVLGAHGSGAGSAHGVAVNGMSVSDFSDPSAPVLVAQFATPKADLTAEASTDWPHVQVDAVKSPGDKRYALLDNAVLGAYVVNISELDSPVGLGNIKPAGARGIRTFTFSEDKSLLFMADGPYPSAGAGKAIYCMRVEWKW